MANLRGYRAPSLYRGRTGSVATDATGTPAPDDADKENRTAPRKMDKGKGRARNSAVETRDATPEQESERRGAKRPRLAERDVNARPRGDDQTTYYNPEQDAQERSRNMLQMRANYKDLHDRHDAIIAQPAELVNLVKKQDESMKRVVQTSDATLDSRFLVQVSDIALKQANTLASGETSAGIDIDEFIAKCMTFMRNGGRAQDDEEDEDATPTATQARRRRQTLAEEEEELNEQGDALPWHIFGAKASTYNRRPALPNFLLGPLSVQKRVRTQTQRTQRSRRETQAPATKPQEIQASDLQQSESNNLTSLCSGIRARLQDVITQNSQALEKDLEDLEEQSRLDSDSQLAADEIEKQEALAFRRHKLSDNWEISLFEFAFHPTSFAQSVENLFYVSFLIKDGHIKLSKDKDGLPTIRFFDNANPETQDARQTDRGGSRHQAIFSLDYKTWKKIVQAYDIKEPMIGHRNEDIGQQRLGAKGWYA